MMFLEIVNLFPNSLNLIGIETIPIKTHDKRNDETRETVAPLSFFSTTKSIKLL